MQQARGWKVYDLLFAVSGATLAGAEGGGAGGSRLSSWYRDRFGGHLSDCSVLEEAGELAVPQPRIEIEH